VICWVATLGFRLEVNVENVGVDFPTVTPTVVLRAVKLGLVALESM
jgi:hypothetical protein